MVISVKQYAEERGITIQAVHQSMAGKRKKEKLDGHVQVIDGVKWLDEEAVAILDEHRNKNPIVIIQQDKDELIDQLRREKEALLVKVAEQGARIGELADWKAEKAMAIAEAAQTAKLLESANADLERTRQDAEAAAQRAAELEQQLQAEMAARAEAEEREYETAQREKQLKDRNWWERLTRKGE